MSSQPSSSTTPLAPVAIIGMGCLFPQAQNLKEYWRLLCQGKDAITEIPETHWSPEDFFDSDPKRPDFTYARRGGFLSPLSFDPSEFGIPPTILEATDTAQLLSLVATKMALEDAGYGKEGREYDKERVSVLMGVTGTLELVIPLGARLGHPFWRKALKDAGIDEEKTQEVVERISDEYVSWQESSFPGLLGNVVAGRIANRMDFGGTNCAVDAACASSLSALHLGLMELATGKADMVISGGADTLNDIFMYMCFSKTPALSPTGDARPFSSDADGTIISEGVGVMVLKRLEDAERDGDRIYAVIKGLGSSSDGRSQSIYAPRAAGQQKAIRRAYEQAGITAADIGLLEAHGTGTKVGDAVEFSALKEVFTDAGADIAQTAMGTVKSQIGHSKAAAGAASMIKAALALHHKTLPPTLKIDSPNPKMGIEDSPLYLNTETRPWLDDKTRRVGVSSFGFGGSNFHAVLEEYRPAKNVVAWDQSVEILAFSGHSPESIQTELAEWLEWLHKDNGLDSQERHRRAFDGRGSFDPNDSHRLLLVLHYEEDWKERLSNAQRWLNDKPNQPSMTPLFAYNAGEQKELGKVAFVFPGQGSQYPGMGRELSRTFPEMMQALEQADVWVGDDLSLNSLLMPAPALSEEERKAQLKALSSTDVAQPALGAVSTGMAKVLQRFGLKAEATAGHSYGELVALWYAGRLSGQSLLQASRERGRLMAGDGSDRGTMLAVSAPLDKVDALLKETSVDVVLANRNSPTQGVLSGSREAIDEAERLCKERGLSTRRFPVSAAFHSRLVQDAQAPFRSFLDKIDVQESALPVYSNTTGEVYPTTAEGVRDRLAEQILSPVRFVEEVESMYAAGVRTFVEVGPKRVLSSLISAILGDRPHQILTLDRSKGRKSGLQDLALLVTEAACLGLDVALSAWEERPADAAPQRMSVPMVGANYRAPRKNQRPPSPPYRPEVKEANAPRARLQASKKVTSPLKSGTSTNGIHAGTAPKPVSAAIPSKSVSGAVASTLAPPLAPPVSAAFSASSGERAMSHESAPKAAPVAPVVQPPTSPQPTAAHPTLVMQAFQVVQQGFQAMQTLQQQTTFSHQRFLESQQETSRALQQMLNSSQQLMAQALHVPYQAPATLQTMPAQTYQAPQPMPAPMPVQPMASAQPMFSTQPVAPAPAYSVPMPAPAPVAAPQTPVATPVNGTHGSNGYSNGAEKASIVPQFSKASEPVAEFRLPTRKETPTARVETPTAPTVDLDALQVTAEEILMSAVSELTGYPQEMLALEMDLEADLGIDSIKRVEILSTVSERLPEASQVDPEEMGTLRTLGQVLDALCALSVSMPTQSEALVAMPSSSSASDVDAQGVLLEVVAELTGYPQEMLALEMDLEADLGIDSIKRVEILSTVSERLPGVSEVDPETMGRLRTLEEVIGELSSLAGGSSAPAANEAPQATNAASAGDEQLTQVLMSVVAELTGYPQEMLALEMDMEADLGIDSIKRVEILSAVTEQVPSLESLDTDELRNLRTLGEIVDAAGSDPGSSGGTEAQGGQQVPFDLASLREELIAGREDDIARRVLQVKTLSRHRNRPLLLPSDSEVWIVDDGTPLARLIAARFEQEGTRARVIALNRRSQHVPHQVSGFVFLSPPMIPHALWSSTEESVLSQAFLWAKTVLSSLESTGRRRGSFFSTVTRMDGMFGLSRVGGFSPLQGGLAGLPKTMHRETEYVSCKALDIPRQWHDWDEVADAIVEECLSRGPLEVGIQPERRVTIELREQAPAKGDFLFDEGDVILITGGARGVTATVAEMLAKAFRPRLVLLGRSPLPDAEPTWLQNLESETELKKALFAQGLNGEPIRHPRELNDAYYRLTKNREILGNLHKLREAGASVHYYSVDVRDTEAISKLVKQVHAKHGPVRGLIHAAGVLEDRKILDKTPEQFDKVFSTKVQGLRSLLEALGSEPLKAMLLFSSVSGRIGNQGQVDYAMANEVLNKVAQHQALIRPDCRVLAANWGPWAGGMVTPELKRHFEKQGVELIPLEAGARAMLRELRTGNEQDVEVVYGGMFHDPEEPAHRPSYTTMEGGEASHGSLPVDVMQDEWQLVKEFVVSPESFPILKAHRIGEHEVVPLALMMEWIGLATQTTAPELSMLGYENVRVLKGIRLREEPIRVFVMAGSLQKIAGHYQLPLEIRSVTSLQSPRVHLRGRAILGEHALPPLPEKKKPSSQLWKDSYPLSIGESYEKVLFHGKELQGLLEIRGHSPQGMRFSVSTAPEPSEWSEPALQEEWLHDPLVMDCAFQAAILWCYAHKDMASLPTFFSSFRQFSAPIVGPIDVVLEVDSASRHKMKGSFSFWNAEGQLLARMRGYECAMNPALLQRFHNP